MPVIDADTHIDETEATWEYIEPQFAPLKPIYQTAENYDPSRAVGAAIASGHYWVIEGKRQRRRVRSDEVTQTTKATRELHGVEARLRHMDQLGDDVHVMFPTLFA